MWGGVWPALRRGLSRAEAGLGSEQGRGSRRERGTDWRGAWSCLSSGQYPLSPVPSCPSEGVQALPWVGGCLSVASRPAHVGARGDSWGSPCRQDSVLSVPSAPSPRLPPSLGADASGHWRYPLSAVASLPLTRHRVAMAGEAFPLAGLLLDSSLHSLFPALRSSCLKQSPSQTLLPKPEKPLCILSGSGMHLLTPCPDRLAPEAQVPRLCWSFSPGPPVSVAGGRDTFPAPPPASSVQPGTRSLYAWEVLSWLVCSPSLTRYLLCISWF